MDPTWEDMDDETFLRRESSDRLLEIRDNAENTERLSSESTKRSLKQLAETELVGLETAEELVRNRDSLRHVSTSLDGISADLKRSQRHVDSVRSVFSSVKNSLFGKKKPNQTIRQDMELEAEEPSQIDSYLSKPKKNGFSFSFPWRDENDKDMLTSLQGRVLTGDITASRNPFNTGGDVDRNLESISSAVNRLKGLATAMGKEIETQNSTLDVIHEKSSDLHVRMTEQSKAIEKIIK